MLGNLRHAILTDEHRDGQQQRVGAHQALQQGEWRRIDVTPSRVRAPGVECYPPDDEDDAEEKIPRAAEERADALDGALQARGLRLAFVELLEELEVLLGPCSQLSVQLDFFLGHARFCDIAA